MSGGSGGAGGFGGAGFGADDFGGPGIGQDVGTSSEGIGGRTAGQIAGDRAAALGIGNIGAISSAADVADTSQNSIDRAISDQLAIASISGDKSRVAQLAQQLSIPSLFSHNLEATQNQFASLDPISKAIMSALNPTSIPTAAFPGIAAGLTTAFGDVVGIGPQAPNPAEGIGREPSQMIAQSLQGLTPQIAQQQQTQQPQMNTFSPLIPTLSIGGRTLAEILGA